ncbi:tryptophan--tRNA ligase [Candidatus Uhrbacteria bacterium CG10_big_fil_rev_8_21_14_0_10_48_11]|uniref:Tryptophan--tRNA ligase n=1 Tax=Candidatus Uhrbacteria bacterium CG10_big_fil_rev_8_21_14_0_10_48_11 TaxID=1975037 RepID=A0A2M8LDQ3_9BACT|nr:MAG: tryptophan--tRNA ligase [Candidatus Uhrbacteria bacterium CG10_big_fil_rev_8_21_14_0_10_48_11]
MATSKKPTTLSGIQPSGKLHIGNYLGALKNFVELQNEYQGFYMVADLHALTEDIDPKERLAQTLEIAAAFIAAGLNQKKSVLFVQSFVPAHVELGWIFTTLLPVAALERMTQYKDKAARQTKNVNAGLLTYPALMAADILLYQPPVVPVGDDQAQHLELTRLVAKKFNQRYGDTFVLPKALHTRIPRLMSLADPTRKMSKSEPTGCLFLDDTPQVIEKKIKRAVTDTSSAPTKEMSAGVKNLFLILEACGDKKNHNALTAAYQKGTLRYSELKEKVADATSKELAPYQKRYKDVIENKAALKRVLTDGAKRAAHAADTTLKNVKERMGILLS